MRRSNDNNLDNLSRKLDKKIKSIIDTALLEKNDKIDKSPMKNRNGLWDLGAFQIQNPREHNGAIFGVSSDTTVSE